MYNNRNNNQQNDLDDILGADDDDIAPTSASGYGGTGYIEPEWTKAEDCLYQQLVVTSAGIADIEDKWNPGRMKTLAFVTFYFYDDPEQKPFKFSTGWLAIRNQVIQFRDRRMFPVECGLIELLDRQPVSGHFPLRFVDYAKLETATEMAEDASILQAEPNLPPVAAPTAPPDAAPSAPARSGAARATGGSVESRKPGNARPKPASPASLRTRGN